MTANSLLVALGIFLSRISGLVRERVFAHYFGNSVAAGAFRAALRIPNFLQNLFGEGVLSASFIPVYSNLIGKEDHETAGKMAGIIATLLTSLVSIICIVGVLFSSVLVDLVAPGFEGEARDLTIQIVKILFPGIGLLVLSAWCLGILNSHRKFFVSYAAPVLWNLAMIVTLLIWGSATDQNTLAIYLAWGTVVGCGLQLLVQIPFIFKYAPRIIFGFSLKLESVRTTIRNTFPVFIGRGVVQISAYIDSMISSFLGAASVAALGYAQTIYLLPISLFGMSVAASELPEMSRIADSTNTDYLRTRLKNAQNSVAFMIIPSIIALSVLGNYAVGAIYQTGQFNANDTIFVWYILIGFSLGLLPNTWGRLYSSTLYALFDTKTPLKCATIRVVATAGLGYLFAFPLRPFLMDGLNYFQIPFPFENIQVGAIALSLSSSLASAIESTLLRRAVAKRIGDFSSAWSRQFKLVFVAIFSASIALLCRMNFGHPILEASLVFSIFGGLYFGLGRLWTKGLKN